MDVAQELRRELAVQQAATKKALALLAHSMAAQHDAAQLLKSLMANYEQAMDRTTAADPFDDLASAMLLAVSSAAVKQHPHDQELLALYGALRSRTKH